MQRGAAEERARALRCIDSWRQYASHYLGDLHGLPKMLEYLRTEVENGYDPAVVRETFHDKGLTRS
jgi:hypothetical protein